MKTYFENIVKGVAKLSDNQQQYIFRQLKGLSSKIEHITGQNERFRQQLTGVKIEDREDMLQKAVDILKLHGYHEHEFLFFKDIFLTWFLNATTGIVKYKPKEMSFDILSKFQDAFMMFLLQYEREPNNYTELRTFLFDWRENLTQKEIAHINKLFPFADQEKIKQEVSYE